MAQFAKKPIASVRRWQTGTTGSLESVSLKNRFGSRQMADAPYVNTGIPMWKSQCISKQKIFWFQRIQLEESAHMYEIFLILNISISYPSAHFICRVWYEGERFIWGGETTTSERYGHAYCLKAYLQYLVFWDVFSWFTFDANLLLYF